MWRTTHILASWFFVAAPLAHVSTLLGIAAFLFSITAAGFHAGDYDDLIVAIREEIA